MTTPAAQHTADECPFGMQLLFRAAPTDTNYECPDCGRNWFVGSITPYEVESAFTRLGRWFKALFR